MTEDELDELERIFDKLYLEFTKWKENLNPTSALSAVYKKKFRKSIWVPFIAGGKALRVVQENDKIAVCISGGDSMLMAKLLQERKIQRSAV